MAHWSIIGHETQVADLREAREAERPSHVYVISGIPQLGKRTIAEVFAAALLCEKPDGPCNDCAQCRLRAAGSHPDLYRIDRDEKLGIDQVRALKSWLTMRPHSAPYRVGVLIDASRLTSPGQNALLKLLEEPPPRTVFLLTAAASSDLLPTVISRCRQITLGVVRPEVIAAALDTPVDQTAEIVRLAAGRPGLAIELAQSPEKLAEVQEWGKQLNDLLDAPADRRLTAAKELAEDPALGGKIAHWISLHRQALEAETTADAFSLDKDAETLSRRLTAPQLTANLRVLVAAMSALRYNPNVLLLVETTLLKLGE